MDKKLPSLRAQGGIVVRYNANRIYLSYLGKRYSPPLSIDQLDTRILHRFGAKIGLFVGTLNRLLEIIAELQVIALPRLQRQLLGLALDDDRTIREQDEHVDLADPVAFA